MITTAPLCVCCLVVVLTLFEAICLIAIALPVLHGAALACTARAVRSNAHFPCLIPIYVHRSRASLCRATLR